MKKILIIFLIVLNLVVPLNVYAKEKGDIIVNKYDQDTGNTTNSGDANFKDVTFDLYNMNDQKIATSKINDDSKIIFKDIEYGKYYIREVYPGEGYIYRNQEKIYITLNENNNTIDFYNRVRKNTIKINKYIKKDDEELVKEEATFKVLNSKNEEVLEFNTVDGYYEFILPYGRYTIKQVAGTKNYEYVDDIEIYVSSNLITQKFDLYSNKLIVPIKIINIDSESKKPILEEKAIFSIINTTTNEIIRVETNNNGETEEIKLLPGIYHLNQIKVVDGYEINTGTIVLDINETNYKNIMKEIYIENDKKTSTIEIDKQINYYLDDKLIDTKNDDDIKIPIYAKEDIYTKDGNIKYSKNQEVDVITNNNLISKNLVYGNYYLNNPVNNEVIDINLNNNKQVKIVEDRYTYNKKISNIPNTYTKDNNSKYLSSFITFLGFVLVYKGKEYEKK